MRKRLWTLTSLIAILLIIGLVGCDNNPVAPVEEDPVLPTIPSEFNEMESISFSGSNPTSIEAARESMGYAIGNISIPIGDLFMNSIDSDVDVLGDLFAYMSDVTNNGYDDSAYAAINIDETNLTGDVNAAMDESYGNVSFKGSLVASASHSNLFEMITETDDSDSSNVHDYTYPMLDMGYDTSTYELTTPLSNASFSIAMNLSGLDIKVTDAQGEKYEYDPVNDADTYVPSGIDTEYLRFMADISITASGSDLAMTIPSDTGVDDEYGDDIFAMTITSGTIDFDIDMDVKLGFVLSSTDPTVNGCKFVGSIDLEDALADFDLSGIDVYDSDDLMGSITDFLNQISAPKITYTVFASDNTYLFEETVNVSDELNDLFYF